MAWALIFIMTFLGGLSWNVTRCCVHHDCRGLPSVPQQQPWDQHSGQGGIPGPARQPEEGEARGLAPGSSLGGRFGMLPWGARLENCVPPLCCVASIVYTVHKRPCRHPVSTHPRGRRLRPTRPASLVPPSCWRAEWHALA